MTNGHYYSSSELPAVFGIDVVCVYLGVSANTAYALIKANKIPHFYVRKQIRVRKEALLDYIAAAERADSLGA